MPYARSRARADLQARLKDIRATISAMERSKPASVIRDYVLAAAVFLGHAELENYISDVVGSYALAVSKTLKRGSEVPGELRSHLFLEKSQLRSLLVGELAGKTEHEVLRDVARRVQGPAGSYINDSVPLSGFDGNVVLTKNKYPSVKNIKKVFARLGVLNVMDLASRLLKRDAEALLQSFGDVRTQLAHTASLTGISPRDVRERLREADKLVGALDRILFSKAASALGSRAWRAHMV